MVKFISLVIIIIITDMNYYAIYILPTIYCMRREVYFADKY